MTGILNLLLGVGGAVKDAYFNLVSLLLPGNGTNGAQNNTFLDGSSNTFTITRNGNTTQGTFSPFSQTGWGNYFAGSQSISIAATASLQYSGDFTIECWFYKPATGDAATFIQQSSTNYFALNVNPGTGINIYLNSASANFVITDRVPQTNTWHHIALVRSGSGSGNIKCYLDGVASSTTATNTSTLGYNAIGYLGAIGTSAGGSLVGYVSNFRIASGRAVYTSNFTPPTSPLTRTTGGASPPQGSETIWLTAQSNRFLDSNGVNTPASSPLTITANGSPSVTPFSPFAPTQSYSASAVGGSGYFDGTGDFLDGIGTAADWAFMSNSTALWSLECWLFVSASTEQAIIDTTAGSSANVGVYVAKTTSNTILVDITRGVAGTRVATGTTTGALTPNAWNHLLVSYDQSLSTQNFKVYINGGSAETFNKTANAPSGSNPTYSLRVGGYNATSTLTWNGYISSLRISNVVRSSSVPTTPYSSDANTKLLLNFTNAGVVDATAKNVLETVGNAQISTTQSKWGGGSISIDSSSSYLTVPSSQLIALGSGDWTVEGWFYFSNVTGIKTLFDQNASTRFYLYLNGTSLNYFTAGSLRITGGTLAQTTWYHIALVRSSGTTKLYLDGTQIGSSYVDSQNYGAAQFVIGSYFGGADYLNGYLDDCRISKMARYTGNFTKPSAPFPVQ